MTRQTDTNLTEHATPRKAWTRPRLTPLGIEETRSGIGPGTDLGPATFS